MITLHHLRIGRPLFTLWLVEELGIEYDLKLYDRTEAGRAPPELREIHPLGKSPVVVDDGHVIAESGAISMYLMEHYDPEGRFSPPKDAKERATWYQWLHYPEASAFSPLLLKLLLSREADPKPPLISGFAEAEVQLQLDYIEQQLGDKDYLLGSELSLPDIGVAYICHMAQRLGQLDGHTALQAYVQRCSQRPAFVRALEKAGA